MHAHMHTDIHIKLCEYGATITNAPESIYGVDWIPPCVAAAKRHTHCCNYVHVHLHFELHNYATCKQFDEPNEASS